jgi:hypothetical protein
MRFVRLSLLILFLASCSASLPTYETRFTNNVVAVPVGEFEMSTFIIVSDDNAPYDVLLMKDGPTTFHSLALECSFDRKPLDTTPEELVCPVCSSIFLFDGTVKKGPAETGLLKLPSELNPAETHVRINITALGQ